VLESIVNPKNHYKFRFGIFAEGKIVGSINMTPSTPMKQAEIGYWIGKEHTGNGYAAKALNTFIPFAFNRPAIERLYAKVAIGNVPSQKTLLKSGFRFGGQDDYWWYFDLTKDRFTGDS
jgi:RimJ/RimL family protein N-acetyltransferase